MQLLNQSETARRVTRVSRVAVKIEAEIHLLACSILEHTRAHGDYTQGVALLNGLPRGQRVKALAFWFTKFSNGKLVYAIDKTSKQWAGALNKQRVDGDFDVAAAMETSFADLTNEQAPKSATVESILKALEAKATNVKMHDDGITPVVTPAARAFASELVKFVRANSLDKQIAA
jgi:hypothetical protein